VLLLRNITQVGREGAQTLVLHGAAARTETVIEVPTGEAIKTVISPYIYTYVWFWPTLVKHNEAIS
jgi:hypothetical protein